MNTAIQIHYFMFFGLSKGRPHLYFFWIHHQNQNTSVVIESFIKQDRPHKVFVFFRMSPWYNALFSIIRANTKEVFVNYQILHKKKIGLAKFPNAFFPSLEQTQRLAYDGIDFIFQTWFMAYTINSFAWIIYFSKHCTTIL